MEPKRERKWSPKASQDGAEKETKNEMKLREVQGAKKRMKVKRWQVPMGPLGEGGETKIAPRPPKTAARPPKTVQDRPKSEPRPPKST